MKRLRLFIASVALLLGLSGIVPALAAADTAKSTVCTALGSDAKCGTDPHGSTSVNSIVATIINILSWIVGIVAVIMIIVGGLRYVTAGGDSNNVSAAKNTVIYAVVGLVIAASAQIIVRFVLDRVT